MKKITSILMLTIVFLAFSAQAQNTPAVSKPNPKAPVIKFEKVIHDYGTIQQSANGDCEFKFKNTGKEPLVLSNVITSCGCTTPSWPKEPIMAGKTGVIKVHYDTNRMGAISKTVTVLSNATEDRVVLTIKGTVVAKPAQELPEKTQSPVSNQ